jgi:hypothetical protein
MRRPSLPTAWWMGSLLICLLVVAVGGEWSAPLCIVQPTVPGQNFWRNFLVVALFLMHEPARAPSTPKPGTLSTQLLDRHSQNTRTCV